jgi:hypothetical protein
MPVHKGEFVLGSVSEVEFSAKISLDRLPYSGDQVFRSSGDRDAIGILLQEDDSFQWPLFSCLLFYIPNARQKLFAMAVGKSTAKSYDAANLAVANLLACRAQFHLLRLSFARCPFFPDAVLK